VKPWSAALIASLVVFVGTGFPGMSDVEGSRSIIAQASRTVWDGVYSDAQAERGRLSYSQSCVACHRDDLKGDGTAPSLVGESFAFLWDDMSVGELFTRIQAIMPPERPASLPAQGYVDIIAFILQKNMFPAGERELDTNPDALSQILITAKRQGH
jgi:cytochrome c553